MSIRLLLDEMLSGSIAEQLRAKGHDVQAAVANPEFIGLPDEEILVGATEAGRALVTANIKDFVPLDARFRASSRSHAGLILLSSRTFPQSRGYLPAVASALHSLLESGTASVEGRIVFLPRA